MDPFDELVTRVRDVTGLTGRAASAVAISLTDQHGERPVSAGEIVGEAQSLGYDVAPKHVQQAERDEQMAEIEMDPAEVLKQVYRAFPRALPKQPDHDQVYLPRVGKAPKDSAFFNEEVQEAIDALPDEIRLLIVGVDLLNGEATITLYDEANDVDRKLGPLDLGRYSNPAKLTEAIRVLVGRLPRVLAADFN